MLGDSSGSDLQVVARVTHVVRETWDPSVTCRLWSGREWSAGSIQWMDRRGEGFQGDSKGYQTAMGPAGHRRDTLSEGHLHAGEKAVECQEQGPKGEPE